MIKTMYVGSMTLIARKSAGTLQLTGPLFRVSLNFIRSMSKKPSKKRFLFSHLFTANATIQSAQNGLESRRFAIDVHPDSTLTWCVCPDPHNWTMRDWSRARPSFT